MKLHEAIESGRWFRRPCFPEGLWYGYRGERTAVMERSDGREYHPDRFDICANDWEIQEPTVTITRTQLAAAVLEMIKDCQASAFITFNGHAIGPDPVKFLCDKLGLSEN